MEFLLVCFGLLCPASFFLLVYLVFRAATQPPYGPRLEALELEMRSLQGRLQALETRPAPPESVPASLVKAAPVRQETAAEGALEHWALVPPSPQPAAGAAPPIPGPPQQPSSPAPPVPTPPIPAAPGLTPAPAEPPRMAPQIGLSLPPRPEVPPAVEAPMWQSPLPQFAPTSPEPAPASAPSPQPSALSPQPETPSLEERIGGQWLNWLGAVTLVMAVGLFLKWAYDMGWITPLFHLPPVAYLCMGWLTGLALLAGSGVLRRSLPLYAQGLAGGGIAALYLTTYAGHALYRTLSADQATIGLVVVGAVAIWMALLHDSVVIGWIGIILAYVSPVLLGSEGSSPAPLFLYLTGLNAVVLGISVMRRWVAFRTAAFAATVLLYVSWHLTKYSMLLLGPALTFVGVNSAIFLAVLALYPLVWKEATHDADLALAVLNPFLAGITFYSILQARHDDWLGLVAVIFAAVYWLLARAIRLRRGEEDYLEQLFFATALVFAVLAVPFQFKGRAMTAGWALMGAALSVVGYRTASTRTRAWGAVALFLSLGRLVIRDAWLSPPSGAAMFFNERGFSFAMVVLSLSVVAGIAVREWIASDRADDSRASLFSGLVFVLCVLMDWWVFLDLAKAWSPVGWTAVAALALAFGWQLRCWELRTVATLFVLPPVLLALLEPRGQYFFSELGWPQPWPIPGWAAALGLSLGAAAAYHLAREETIPERWLSPVYSAAAAALLMIRAAMDLSPVWIPVAWAAVAAGVMLAGFRLRSTGHRTVGACAAAATAAYLFYRHMQAPPSDPLLAAGFLAGLAALALGGILYHSRAEDPVEQAAAVFFTAAAAAVAMLWATAQAPPIWRTTLWAAVALVVLAVGGRTQSLAYRLVAAGAAVLALGRLFYFNPGTSAATGYGDFWQQAPGFAGCLALCVAMAWAYSRSGWVEEEEGALMVPAAAGAAAAVAMTWGAVELGRGWLPLSWLAVALALLWAGVAIDRAPLRLLAVAVSVLLTGEVVLRELALPFAHSPLFHSRAAGALAALGSWIACAWVLSRYGGEEERRSVPGLVLAVNLQALAWLSLEAMDIGGRLGPAQWAREASQFGLSAVWVGYAAAAIWVGFRRHLQGARWGGMALLLAAVAKVYLFDLGFLALGYRVLSFLVLALVLLGVSYLYQRQTEVRRA
jgi:uncharacterized membrane protein